jgi:putative N-acetyltransferase (TIGR04045 family)
MTTSPYTYKLAASASEYEAYCELRQMIFAEEQGLFEQNDEDQWDAIAYPIVALNTSKQVVGVVRIYEIEPEVWYGGRLGVHPDYRRVGQIGRGLIYKAVTTANTWGCRQFLATVQLQNVKFFRRQHWHSLEEIVICDRPHHLMQADLEHYPPSNESRPTIEYWRSGMRELEAS